MANNPFIVDDKLANQFGRDYVKILVALLRGNRPHSKVATGSLINSINYKLRDTAKGIQIILEANDYLKFVDQGINGVKQSQGSPYSYKLKYPPIKEIKRWISIKGLALNPYAVQRSIFNKGIKPTHVLRRTVKEIETSKTFIKKYEEGVVDRLIKNLQQIPIQKQIGFTPIITIKTN